VARQIATRTFVIRRFFRVVYISGRWSGLQTKWEKCGSTQRERERGGTLLNNLFESKRFAATERGTMDGCERSDV
jgi:hypothetical protein